MIPFPFCYFIYVIAFLNALLTLLSVLEEVPPAESAGQARGAAIKARRKLGDRNAMLTYLSVLSVPGDAPTSESQWSQREQPMQRDQPLRRKEYPEEIDSTSLQQTNHNVSFLKLYDDVIHLLLYSLINESVVIYLYTH